MSSIMPEQRWELTSLQPHVQSAVFARSKARKPTYLVLVFHYLAHLRRAKPLLVGEPASHAILTYEYEDSVAGIYSSGPMITLCALLYYDVLPCKSSRTILIFLEIMDECVSRVQSTAVIQTHRPVFGLYRQIKYQETTT